MSERPLLPLSAERTGPSGRRPSLVGLLPLHPDRLPCSRFQSRVAVGLGSVWILVGLEQVAGSRRRPTKSDR